MMPGQSDPGGRPAGRGRGETGPAPESPASRRGAELAVTDRPAVAPAARGPGPSDTVRSTLN
eukprot:613065-Hanusia_phi.AAC.3